MGLHDQIIYTQRAMNYKVQDFYNSFTRRCRIRGDVKIIPIHDSVHVEARTWAEPIIKDMMRLKLT